MSDVEQLPPPMAMGSGLKGKSPAGCVAGKHVPKPSAKVHMSEGTLDRNFSQIFTESRKHAEEPAHGPNKRTHISSTPQDANINEDMPELQDLHIVHEEEGDKEEEEEDEEQGEEEEGRKKIRW
ncbi:hypothetical protein DXG01_016579 [Tephrocybe rancida]|nr:hypothetical protein DXG01_016579 [Tephrocybe rancida]